MAKKEDKEKIMDTFLDGCKDLNLDEIIVFANNSSDRSQVMTCIKSSSAPVAMAMIGMLIKMLSEETDIPSPKIAEMIRDKLEYAEKKFKEEIEKKEHKVIHIKITDAED